MKTISIYTLIIITLLSLSFSSCLSLSDNNEVETEEEKIEKQKQNDWNIAREKNTIESYQYIKDKYPDDKDLIKMANLSIEEKLIWGKTIQKDTLEAYRNYIKEYPNGRWKNYAKREIEIIEEKQKEEEEQEYLKAKLSYTKESFNKFIQDYPKSDYAICAEVFLSFIEINEEIENTIGKKPVLEDDLEKLSNPYGFEKDVPYSLRALRIFQWINREETLVIAYDGDLESNVFHINLDKIDVSKIEENIDDVILLYNGDYKYESLSGRRLVPSFDLVLTDTGLWEIKIQILWNQGFCGK